MRSSVCILRTRSKEMKKKSRISGAIIVAAIFFFRQFWGFQCERIMCFTLRKEYLWYNRSSRDFGTRGCCEM
jgi:hypothetical protein